MLFLSKCTHCKGSLLMFTKRKHKSYSCSRCVDKFSGLRDEMNETYDHELLYLKGPKK